MYDWRGDETSESDPEGPDLWTRPPDERIAAIAGAQKGLIAWDQVREAGIAPKSIRQRNQLGIRFHTADGHYDEISEVRGIPVTGPSRTLLDLGQVLDDDALERAFREAEQLGLTDVVNVATSWSGTRAAAGAPPCVECVR